MQHMAMLNSSAGLTTGRTEYRSGSPSSSLGFLFAAATPSSSLVSPLFYCPITRLLYCHQLPDSSLERPRRGDTQKAGLQRIKTAIRFRTADRRPLLRQR